MSNLLCCPFCGGEPKYTDNYNENGTWHCVFLSELRGGYGYFNRLVTKINAKIKSFELWNNRINCPYCGYNVSEETNE